jgi:hypothetical protein
MSGSETTSQGSPEGEHEPRLSTLRLVHAIGARLAAPLEPARREALIASLATAAAGSTEDGGADGAPDREDELGARRRARRTRWFAVAAAGLVVVASVGVVTRMTEDLPVIVLAGGSQGSPMLGADRGAMEVMPADASPMIGLWVPTIFRFELADGVALSAERATAWRSVPPADLTAAAARLAGVLGLAAPTPAEWDPGALSTQDDDGASLTVLRTGDWYYGGPADLWPAWDCLAVPYAGDDEGASGERGGAIEPGPDEVECTAPEPPVGVPSAESARALAVEFLARAGHADVRIVDVSADDWGASVQAEVALPGSTVGSGVSVSVGFAGGGRVSWANGTFARIERLGDYPLIGVQAALVRLEAEVNAWLDDDAAPMPMPMPRALPADDCDAVTSDADTPVTILPVPELPGSDLPDGPREDLEPVERTVRIVAVELVTSLVWAAGDEQVLLPHYRLIDEDGGWWFVVALEDRYLAR